MLRTIPTYPSYCAGVDGHIYRDGRQLRERDNGHGYKRVTLSQDGVIYTRYVHRLVCEAFHGECPIDKEQVRHLDNCRSNNIPTNVEWATRRVNESDKEKFGTLQRGEKAKHAVLTEEIVRIARERATQRERIEDIAKDFGIKSRVMADAITGRRWGWLPGAVPAFHTRRKLTDDDVRAIRLMIHEETHHTVAAKFNVSRQAVTLIANRKTYTHVE